MPAMSLVKNPFKNVIAKSKSGFADVLNKEDSRFLRKLENINIILEIHCICDLEEVKGEAKSQGIKKHNFVKSYIDDHIKMHSRMVRKRVSVNLLL